MTTSLGKRNMEVVVACRWVAGLLVLWLIVAGCAPTELSPTTTSGALNPTRGLSPTLEPSPTPSSVPSAQEVLTQAISRLDGASSYRFTISATHGYTLENTIVEWQYRGQGAYAAQARYEWVMEGQANVSLHVIAVGGQVYCADTRGRLPSCSLAWGGPSPGSSPYTAIAYIRNFEQVGNLETRALEGRDYLHFTFVPSIAKIMALEPPYEEAMAGVSSVDGEVWIDMATGLPRRERIVVESSTLAGAKQKVELILSFFDFDQPVEISLPTGTS